TPTENAGSGTSALNVSMLVQNLEAGVTYHFRLVGSSSAGTTRGADRTFTTDAAPSVMTGPAQSVTATTAVVTGTINPRGRASTVWFEYGTSTAYGSKTAPQSAGFATTYHFRLVAFSSRGTTRGADATFKTLGPPTARTGPVTQISTSSATVSGRVNTFGLAGTYWIEYGHTASYGLRTNPANLTPTSSDVGVSVGLSGLEPGRRYHFRV